ncbi:MAG: hypothetical protein QM811_08075 [Pirellulales bacterium]
MPNPAVTRAPPYLNGAPYNPTQPYAPSPYGATTPYYQPGPTGPDSLYPNGFGEGWGNWQSPQMGNVEFRRFLQRVRFSYAYLGGGDDPTDLGVNDMEIAATFDVPLFQLEDHFLVTPGFALHLWDGPVNTGTPTSIELPPNTYDAYLDVGWNPRVTNWFGAELGVRVGAYTDFDTFTTDSIRVMGRGLGVVNLSPTLQFKLGVIYIDRNDIKLLPAGGLIWDPSEDRHWEIFFPRPKFAQRLSTVGNYDMWLYLAGEYGGGAWTFTHSNEFPFVGDADSYDYNDLRAMLGVEFLPDVKNGRSGFIEAGFVFKRKLVYVDSANPCRCRIRTWFAQGSRFNSGQRFRNADAVAAPIVALALRRASSRRALAIVDGDRVGFRSSGSAWRRRRIDAARSFGAPASRRFVHLHGSFPRADDSLSIGRSRVGRPAPSAQDFVSPVPSVNPLERRVAMNPRPYENPADPRVAMAPHGYQSGYPGDITTEGAPLGSAPQYVEPYLGQPIFESLPFYEPGGPEAVIMPDGVVIHEADDPIVAPGGGLPGAKDGPLQRVEFQQTALPNLGGSDGLDVVDLENSFTIGLPFPDRESPLLITPGFDLHFLSGPTTVDLPAHLYDTYLGVRWLRRVSDKILLNSSVSPGWFSDWESNSTDALRAGSELDRL